MVGHIAVHMCLPVVIFDQQSCNIKSWHSTCKDTMTELSKSAGVESADIVNNIVNRVLVMWTLSLLALSLARF
jgi:hypothetical protein